MPNGHSPLIVPPAPLEALGAALGADVTRIERELRLELRAALAEHELRVRALEQQIAEQAARLAAVPPPEPGRDGAPGRDGDSIVGPPGEPGPAGRDGTDGRCLAFRGAWKGDKVYGYLDVVAHDGGSWVALQDAPGAIPGDGWQLLAARGKAGPPGPRGERGERGY